MKLQAHKAFDPVAAFQVVDDWNYGYIDQTNLKNFLRKHGNVTSDADLLAIIRRIDLDGDARINEIEFSFSLKLEQPFSKANFRHYQKQIKQLNEQSLGPFFTNHLKKRQTDQLDVIGERPVIGRQFRPKPKVIIPNCQHILPQRYKKDFEERFVGGESAEKSA